LEPGIWNLFGAWDLDFGFSDMARQISFAQRYHSAQIPRQQFANAHHAAN
jgi:hypothetical protein